MSVIALPRIAPDADGMVRDRAIRLFTFLREYTQLRASTVLTTDSYDEVIWLADVPGLPGCDTALNEAARDPEVWLEVRKPRLTPAPRPPDVLEPWLEHWADSSPERPPVREAIPTTAMVLAPRQGLLALPPSSAESETGRGGPSEPEQAEPPAPQIQLDDRPDVRVAYEEYLNGQWLPWAREDRPLQRAQRIYTDLFRLRQSQQRLGEAYEVVMGIGHLSWRTPSGEAVRRHVVVAQTDIRFDADRGVISVTAAVDGARPALEQDMLEPNERPPHTLLDEISDDLETAGDDIFTQNVVVSAARRWVHGVSARGRFDDSLRPARDVTEEPVVHLAPAVILRRRSDRSIVQALNEIVDQLHEGAPIPDGVRRLVDFAEDGQRDVRDVRAGGRGESPLEGGGQRDVRDVRGASRGESPLEGGGRRDVRDVRAGGSGESPLQGEAEVVLSEDASEEDAEEILFPLPANDTQLEIVQRLRHRPGVLVQGPPGTGKSHTIANLVAHLLASGQRVLVTSHTARALEVLRHRIPPEVRELAVVVLGNDARGREELQASVHGISERYASWNQRRSDQRVAAHRRELAAAGEAEADLKGRLRELRERDVERHSARFGGYEGTTQEIARQLRARTGELGWVPDAVRPDSEPPVSDAEAVELLGLLRGIDALEEADLDRLPAGTAELPDAEGFARLRTDELAAAEASEELALARDHRAFPALMAASPDAVEDLADAVAGLRQRRASLIRRSEPWVAAAAPQVVAGMAGRWRELDQMTRTTLDGIRQFVPLVGAIQVSGVEGHDLAGVRADAGRLREHLEQGGGLGVGPVRPEPVKRARYLIDRARIDGVPCRDAASLGRLAAWAYVHERLGWLDAVWAPIRPAASGTVALRCAEYADVSAAVQDVLRLEEAATAATTAALGVPGLTLPEWEDEAALAELLRAVEACRRERRAQAARARLDELQALSSSDHPAAQGLASAVRERDAEAYGSWRQVLGQAAARLASLLRRRELAERLRAAAPRLTSRLTATAADPAWDTRLAALEGAWEWARADGWLAALAEPTVASRLERDLDDARQRSERAVRGLAAELAWAHCLSRLTERERAHLQTWEEAVRKIGKGTGKHAARWRRQAREAMHGCRSAIPAWIMPIFKVADTVDMAPEAFDVVIVDEASQSGPEALFLQFLGRRVIVVGDDQQISPENVGLDRDQVQLLNSQYLHDIPLAMHYDADTSYFTHASIRYGDRLVLQEHFRCMPEIIQFSNTLCYRDRPLVPLRQFGSERLRPAIQVRHVADGTYADGQVNVAEANAIVEQVMACLDDPAYAGKSMGVISLVGSEQARLIGRLLTQRVGPAEIERRRLLCGDAYAFQGDERDVVFLSLVQAPRDGHRLYAATADRDRRRFNVAASRARDQLWLFHTATLEDLHPNGLPHRLLHYCLEPAVEASPAEGLAVEAWRRRASERVGGERVPHPFETWLELDVFLSLVDRGYRVIPQHEVAGYLVDLMVEGVRGRLAVECDGDRWTGPEGFERDLVRQRMLERCGLPFTRVRGAAFYRDPEAALEPLWADLKQYDIQPRLS
jgi:very-short-patch-repair endonuclease